MNSRVKIALSALGFFTFIFISWSFYGYFFDRSKPQFSLMGLDDGGAYAGDVACLVSGSDSYKVSDISVWLDGKALVNRYKVNRSCFDHEFTIPTRTITNGKHIIKIEVADACRSRNVTAQEFAFYADNQPLQAAFVRPTADARVFQGRTLHVQFQTNKEIGSAHVNTLAQTFPCFAEAPGSLIHECFIPIKSDEMPNEHPLSIEIVDRVGNTVVLDTKFQIVMYPFRKQNLVLNTEKIKQEDAIGKSESALEADIERVTKASPAEKLWKGVFDVPCDARGISTEYGTVRITQERGKYAHNAIDFIGTPKSIIWAPQDGVVVIKDRYAHAGNTIGIDHGAGVLTLFFHLDSFANVEVGDKIRKGKPVGTLGMTGYASGYHLHWELRVNNIAVDPIQWTRHDF